MDSKERIYAVGNKERSMSKDEALDLALEALESTAHGQDLYELEEKAIAAINQARSAPVQEKP